MPSSSMALARASSLETFLWAWIETAPRDGTPLLLWLPAPLSKPAIGHWNRDLFCWVVEDGNLERCDEHQPSHWASVTPPTGF